MKLQINPKDITHEDPWSVFVLSDEFDCQVNILVDLGILKEIHHKGVTTLYYGNQYLGRRYEHGTRIIRKFTNRETRGTGNLGPIAAI